jgi:hypothetical protein
MDAKRQGDTDRHYTSRRPLFTPTLRDGLKDRQTYRDTDIKRQGNIEKATTRGGAATV